MTNSMPQAVIRAFAQIGQETGKEMLSEAGKMAESVITAKALLGDISEMSPMQMAQARADDERRKQEEMSKIRAQMGQGRDVEQEMIKIHKDKEEEEKQKEKEFLENLRAQREAERAAMEAQEEPQNSQAEKAKAQKMPRGKKRTSMPDPMQMSATSEFKKGID